VCAACIVADVVERSIARRSAAAFEIFRRNSRPRIAHRKAPCGDLVALDGLRSPTELHEMLAESVGAIAYPPAFA